MCEVVQAMCGATQSVCGVTQSVCGATRSICGATRSVGLWGNAASLWDEAVSVWGDWHRHLGDASCTPLFLEHDRVSRRTPLMAAHLSWRHRHGRSGMAAQA